MHSSSAGNCQGTNVKKKKSVLYLQTHSCMVLVNDSLYICFAIPDFQLLQFLPKLFRWQTRHSLSSQVPTPFGIFWQQDMYAYVSKNSNVNALLLNIINSEMQNQISTWVTQELEYNPLNAAFCHAAIFFPKLICWAILAQNGNAVNYPTPILQITEQIITCRNWVLICYSRRRQLQVNLSME